MTSSLLKVALAVLDVTSVGYSRPAITQRREEEGFFSGPEEWSSLSGPFALPMPTLTHLAEPWLLKSIAIFTSVRGSQVRLCTNEVSYKVFRLMFLI